MTPAWCGHASETSPRRTTGGIRSYSAMLVEKAAAGLEIPVITWRQGQVLGLGELLRIGDHADGGHRVSRHGRLARCSLRNGGLAFRNLFRLGGVAPPGCFGAARNASRTKRPARPAPGALGFGGRHLQAHRAARSFRKNRDQLAGLGGMPSITALKSALPVTTASSCISHSAVVPGSTSAGAAPLRSSNS